ncbi:hypothetical protein MCOR27_009850 [Pyricularia oryzae]|uniref:Nucleoside transporter n=2 Tax=Pyricularia TaxID=48558 RepID=A0ABQ8P1M9_PYRGI|nr:hypothetical protein MCOR01_001497 [Pyricularia oryzae]KAI6304173.1 hypothetical protein MCOR33_000687 [Pyricularia grisea]KAH9429955.1 hypothetical protein MCOR02_009677 [Pyricularia oryzae]KAI6262486.1 hypothetical protein MCOR19_001362 [Pyricularia oryzae]KAI6265985.1 hypothetical protein MCOR26_010450 [Pyricularia oryzae]
MDRIRSLFARHKPIRNEAEYEPLTEDGLDRRAGAETLLAPEDGGEVPFSWVEYLIFAMVGVAMLWAWNMFMAAAPYFQMRFRDDPWLLDNFQSAILSTSTFTNLAAMLVLTGMQKSASYPLRINTALIINTCTFALLTISTVYFLNVSPGFYLVFVLVTVALSAWATGMMQNGAFAFAASFGRPEYTQAIMAGQGVAGVLPPIAQVVSVLVFPAPIDDQQQQSSQSGAGNAAFIYFLTAVVVSAAALFSFIPLVRRHNALVEMRLADQMAASHASIEEAERAARRVVGPVTLFRKLHFVAGAVFICFALTMFFPVFTTKIVSVRTGKDVSPIFQPQAFIPLAFFFWNMGDLAGRMATILPFSLRHRPATLFGLGVARVLFLPLYLLCNVGGRGAAVNSDLFYLLLVQLPFGLTNGWLGSSAMMAAAEWVDEPEREAAGSFMSLSLVAGLTVGSLLSFTASGV